MSQELSPSGPAEGARPGRKARSWVVNLILCLVAFALLGWTVYSNRAKLADVLHREIDWKLFAAAFLIYLSGLMLTFVRWFVLLKTVDVHLRLVDVFRLGFIGNVFNLVIPGAVGGDVVKAGFLYGRVPPDRRAKGMASMVIDRMVGLIGLFLLAAAMGGVAWPRASAEVHRLTWIALGASACGLFGLGLLFTPALYRPAEKLLHFRPRLEHVLEQLVGMASAFRARKGVVGFTIGMSMANHTMNVVAFYLVGRALFGAVPSLFDHFVIVPLVLFTTAVPLPFGALGLSEQVSEQLFDLVEHPGGAIAMMGFRLVMYAAAAVSVVVYLANMSQVREYEKTIEQAREQGAEMGG
ncbi:MAG: lysylphosphatidylglycerol synthase transmembrane domain-containing protein [Isosphaeraceae bacterium]